MCTCTAHTVQLCLNYISLTYITYVCMYVCYSTTYIRTYLLHTAIKLYTFSFTDCEGQSSHRTWKLSQKIMKIVLYIHTLYHNIFYTYMFIRQVCDRGASLTLGSFVDTMSKYSCS